MANDTKIRKKTKRESEGDGDHEQSGKDEVKRSDNGKKWQVVNK